MKTYKTSNCNKQILENREKFIADCEAEYFNQLQHIVNHVKRNIDDISYILVAGPSSSGKTTSTHYLCDLLEQSGIKSNYVSLDDFFINREDTATLPNGNKDYENILSLDINEMHKCFKELNTTHTTHLPKYNFFTGINTKNAREIKSNENTITVVEGNHAFNPLIEQAIETTKYIKVLIYPESVFVDENNKVLIDSTNLRLLRRTIRDVANRGYSPSHTFNFWQTVLDGEKEFINPYLSTANFVVDSVYAYELAAYKIILHSLLANCKSEECDNLLNVVNHFEIVNITEIPEKSLMWEFLTK